MGENLKKIQELCEGQKGDFLPRLLERFLLLENWRLYTPDAYEYFRSQGAEITEVSIHDFNYALQLIRDIAIELARLKLKLREFERGEGAEVNG